MDMRPLTEALWLDGIPLHEADVADPPSTEDLRALLEYAGGSLPESYLQAIRRFDGLYGWFGDCEDDERGYIVLDSCQQVLATCGAYGLPEEGSTFLPIGSDGGGMFFAYDFGTKEWVCVDMVCVGFPEDELGRYPTLREMLEGFLAHLND